MDVGLEDAVAAAAMLPHAAAVGQTIDLEGAALAPVNPPKEKTTEVAEEADAAAFFQRMWRGFKVRRSMGLAQAAQALIKMQEHEFEVRSQAAMERGQADGIAERSEGGDSMARVVAAQQRLTELRQVSHFLIYQSPACLLIWTWVPRQELRSNHVRHHRPSWWTTNAKLEIQHNTVHQVEADVARRQIMMIRRATHEWYFSAAQVKTIVECVPIGRRENYHRVAALVVLFGRITDIENVAFDRLLGHNGYDQDGNHMVSSQELEQCRTEPFPLLCGRIGIANLFNPLCPEREYALNLKHHDEATVAQLLVILTAEPGENLMYETYNGMPFDVGVKWETQVPQLGIFCSVYNTPPQCASFALRLPLARKLLLGGRGRWRAVDESLRNGVENPEDFEGGEETDYTGFTLDADGSMVSREAVEARLSALEASKAARAEREKARAAQEKRASMAASANTLKAMTAVSLKFVRKVRGIKPDVKMPPPVPGMGPPSVMSRAPVSASAKAQHEAAERRTKAVAPIKEEVEEVDSAAGIMG